MTLQDTEERRRYLNARSTIERLLAWRSVPVINENDTVATNEIRYGDNDRLAARVATMASADLLVLLSDVDGLYDAPPGANSKAKRIPLVARITPEIEAMAGAAGSELSRGGMQTKIEAGKIATQAGTHMVIASGRIDHPLKAIADGAACTWFLTAANPVTARKKWIAGSLEPKGTLIIDKGAVAALNSGKSLLPAGVIKVEGAFARGDAVVIRGPDGAEVGARARRLRRRGCRQDQGPLVGRHSRRSWASAAAPRWCTGTIWWSGRPEAAEVPACPELGTAHRDEPFGIVAATKLRRTGGRQEPPSVPKNGAIRCARCCRSHLASWLAPSLPRPGPTSPTIRPWTRRAASRVDESASR